MRCLLILSYLLLHMASLLWAPPSVAAAEVSFDRDVKPILSNNCFQCHGPDEATREGGLRLDRRDSAAHVLEIADGEPLLLQRVTTSDPLDLMPPPASGKSLSPEQVEVLRAWIAGGAVFEQHWAFEKPERPAVPTPNDASWTRSAIDAIILARLEKESLPPSPEADRQTLLRRVSLDLTGLPPTPEELESFLNDQRPDAYEQRVDTLLASPHFGERWGRHWLDAARYADSNGYSIDGARTIWPYRDWVIDALNRNMPFDQFVIEQMAGDLLPEPTQAQRVATGFHRNTMLNQEGGIDEEEFRLEGVMDRVNTIGTVFFGLTVACARCHSHKYDPIEHDEYFRLVAFMNNDDEPELSLPTPEQAAQQEAVTARVRALEKALREYIAAEQPGWEQRQTLDFVHRLEAAQREAIATPAAERSQEQQALVEEVFTKQHREARERAQDIRKARAEMPEVPTTLVLKARREARETRLLEAGDYTRPAHVLAPGTPAVLHPLPEGASTRLDLARWIVSPENPLTARVTVNRMWMRLFGKGLVETEDDFGVQGAQPSHPELLDWLAVEFVESGWNLKHMLRLMATSSTYRQASTYREDIDAIDPRNVLLARQNRLRLDAEIIRDTALAASGLLNPSIGGPSVFPPQPDGVMKLGQSQREWAEDTGENRYRRGLYTYFWRATPHPSLMVFDAPDAQTSCTRRNRSNTPLQALTLLNDEAFVEFAGGLAVRTAQNAASTEERIAHMFRLCLGRAPTQREAAIVQGLLQSEQAASNESAAWRAAARAIMNLDEFITRE